MKYLLLVLTICCPLLVQAQSVIPYNGYLEANGQQSAGNVQMRFALYSDDAAANELWRSWTDANTWHTVPLSKGRFSVNLGGTGQAPLVDDTVFAGNSHYLRILIKAGEEHSLPLQKLQSVPKAVLAERATSFKVTQDLTVAGKTTLGANPQDKPGIDYNEELVVTRRDGAGRDPEIIPNRVPDAS